MKSLPCINVQLSQITENANQMKAKCLALGIDLTGVVKGVAGDIRIAQAFLAGGIDKLGDSRLKNIKKFREAGLNVEYLLLRLPDPSRAAEVVKLTDLSLNSELFTLKALGREARLKKTSHNVIIMVDVGDLREGVLPKNLNSFVARALEIPGINIVGLGTNVGCYGGVLPTTENTRELVELKEGIEDDFGVELKIISGGNTATTVLIDQGKMPAEINHLRVGEGIIQGTDITNQRDLPGFNQDNITLSAAIIELKRKPSVPRGKFGYDAFGQQPSFEDRGERLRAILNVGRQDIRVAGLRPSLDSAEIIGASSDHILVDITDVEVKFHVGDVLDFHLDYSGVLSAMTSQYVNKNYIE